MTEKYKDHLYALVFCGGGGTRLWPYSTQDKPKQFIHIFNKKTLIRQTFERLTPLLPIERIWIVTVPDYVDEVKEELTEIPVDQILVEPARRDTLMAAGLGAVAIQKKDPDAIIANIWSDQVIGEPVLYRESLLVAAKTAVETNGLVTTGLKPAYAHPGLEYVKKGDLVKSLGKTHVYKMAKMIERPSRSGEDPKKVASDKDNLWNVGLFVWTVDTFLEIVKKNSPKVFQSLSNISKHLGKSGGREMIVKEYEKAEKMQIDMPISKNMNNAYVVEGHFDWIDVGDFKVMWDIGKKDEQGNVFEALNGGEWIDYNTKNSLIISEGKRIVATVGVEDLVIVATDNAVLVTKKSSAQDVKQIVNQLKELKKDKYL
ncbi:hypothetical protein A2382_00885 [Candidatus Woesebacteria bacterium RIFOXYB1_FULL_38_16]|uniref:Nucleotidyl transferase domain-containing protein n=1 Tax=Candidatus Woesebacteria bacterium RIFOXYB1_FULL_38_16 TaxID=1802538 RepID=A0A1F8CSS7_9BACT|nr:MAG: hypothetical protein A2191_00600 [Candidatus Woesebacteria bacterium RIFOXYA1_FULL_38_9]OGM79321.1 MAG: hypothetical protein A2382_00885 [Candidatus Woesebacteria bacterium RIFOXYB1_FULL_38_16]